MDVTSWLAGLFSRREPQPCVDCLKRMGEAQELRRALEATNRACSTLEAEGLDAERKCELAENRVGDLESQITYLKGQIEIYQGRLGLLPQTRQGESPAVEQRPLRQPRVPFAQAAAKIQADRTEEYWRQRAEAVEIGATGSTSQTTATVSEKEA